jgi:PAS domain-containing protein
MTSSSSGELPTLQRPSVSASKLALLVVLLAITGVLLVIDFSQAQEKREMVNWQNKLNLIADSRAADISNWLDMYFRELGSVANNPSLQLYVSALEAPKPQPKKDGAKAQSQDEEDSAAVVIPSMVPTPSIPGMPPLGAQSDVPPEAIFLRNLLLVTADRLGFLNKDATALNVIQANVKRPTGTGLAIVDMHGKVLASTEGLAVLDATVKAKVADAPTGKASLIDMFTAPGGEMRIGFVIPIYPIQADPTASNQSAMLVGVKTLGEDFARLLVQPGSMDRTLEALLLRKQGGNVEYLPVGGAGDNGTLSSTFALSTPDLDGVYALSHPESFALKRDRDSHRVLMTSRTIDHTHWVLLLHIDRDQALAESDSWRIKMVVIMFFALLALISSIVAAWWYGTSRRATLLSVQTGRLAAHSLAQEKLLRLVTDNQPEPIFIADRKNIVRFANEKAGMLFHAPTSDVVGKDLTALMGQAASSGYMEANLSALSIDKPLGRTHSIGEGPDQRILRSEHIPLAHIPIDGLEYPSPGVLIVDQDVTEIVNERERRVRILNQLIGTLIRMVDARDPYAANHSASVALIAREVAKGLSLDQALVETAQTAGNLMNIGKIVVSSQILTKPGALGEDEKQAVRDSLQKTVELLHGIDFDGPVVETLRQSAERYDGTGPLKLKGEAILITARIIAVANSFVGMISPRSYRAAIGTEQAATILLKDIDTQFDRRVVVALINFIENKQGKTMLAEIGLKKNQLGT